MIGVRVPSTTIESAFTAPEIRTSGRRARDSQGRLEQRPNLGLGRKLSVWRSESCWVVHSIL